jgi:hypothetical protein
MAFEYDDRKIRSTLLITRRNDGRYQLAGLVRITDANGDTTLRLTQAVDNSDIGLTHYQDWGVSIT